MQLETRHVGNPQEANYYICLLIGCLSYFTVASFICYIVFQLKDKP